MPLLTLSIDVKVGLAVVLFKMWSNFVVSEIFPL